MCCCMYTYCHDLVQSPEYTVHRRPYSTPSPPLDRYSTECPPTSWRYMTVVHVTLRYPRRTCMSVDPTPTCSATPLAPIPTPLVGSKHSRTYSMTPTEYTLRYWVRSTVPRRYSNRDFRSRLLRLWRLMMRYCRCHVHFVSKSHHRSVTCVEVRIGR